jgi:hypothetical protein
MTGTFRVRHLAARFPVIQAKNAEARREIELRE